MIRNEKCEVLDKQNFEPKYRRVYDNRGHQFQKLKDMRNQEVKRTPKSPNNTHFKII